MLNNIYFVALHVFDVHCLFLPFPFKAFRKVCCIVMLLIGSLVEFAARIKSIHIKDKQPV